MKIDPKDIDSNGDEEVSKAEWEKIDAPAGAEWWKGTSQLMNGDFLGAVSAVCNCI